MEYNIIKIRIMNTRFSYLKYAGMALCSLLLLFACSKDDGPGKEPEKGRLTLEATAVDIDEGDKVTFAVTADGKAIDADIYIDDTKINGTTYAFDKTGVYEVRARKEGYTQSDIQKIEVYRTNVYVAGLIWKGGGTKNIATYWKNGQPVILSDGTEHAYASSIFVDKGDVYVAGEEGDNAIYWKNGQTVTLSNEDHYTNGNSIFVDGGDVYVAGTSRTKGETSIATYWKNDQPIALSAGANNTNSSSIFVDKGDVYVAGTSWNTREKSIATYWKNGQPVTLSDGTEYAYARSIFVDKGDVYVAGNDGSKAVCYWKNGQSIDLGNGVNNTYIGSIFIDKGDIYVAGVKHGVGSESIVYWKNGVRTELSSSIGGEILSAEMLYALNGDVYIAGTVGTPNELKATYWKNGVKMNLGDGGYLGGGSAASSIFVTRTLGEK